MFLIYRRRPSWTDRILFKAKKDISLKITQYNYKSHPSYVQSDHKPVSAEFKINIRTDNMNNIVEFRFINPWYINEENSVTFKLIGPKKLNNVDWIGLFEEDFCSLNDYIAYEYVYQGKLFNHSCKILN